MKFEVSVFYIVWEMDIKHNVLYTFHSSILYFMYPCTVLPLHFVNFLSKKIKCINSCILHKKYWPCNIRNLLTVQMWMYNIILLCKTAILSNLRFSIIYSY